MHANSLWVVVPCFALGMVLQALIMLRARFRPGDARTVAIVIGVSLAALLPFRRDPQYLPVQHWFGVCATAALLFAGFFRARLLPRIGGPLVLACNIVLVFVVLQAGWTSPFLLVPLGFVSFLTVVNAFTVIDQSFGLK